MGCSLVNLGSCLPQVFFEFLRDIINAPLQPFLQLTLKLLSEPIQFSVFSEIWAIIVYMLSLFYALLLVGSGLSFMVSGYDAAKRENAKEWLKNIVIMIILVQSSFFFYKLVIDLSSAMTSATLSLVDPTFFLLSTSSLSDLALSIGLGGIYLITLLLTSLILTIRYAIVAIGVVFLPLGIFFYFIDPLKPYGSLILNFLGMCIFVTFFDAILLIGFSQLASLEIFSSLQVIVLIAAFLCIDLLMFFLLIFSILKSAFSAYNKIKRLGAKLA